MKATTRVDFHCHSTYSDGALEPGEVAEALAADGVAFASLTDHDTVEGLAAFGEALAQREIGFITGVELTVQSAAGEVHLLGYGIDPAHPELQATLLAMRQAQAPATQSIAESLRKRGAFPGGNAPDAREGGAAVGGRLSLAEGLALIHRAGGKAFLAHPLTLEADAPTLRDLLMSLKLQGLDGVEALYGPSAADEQQRLAGLAHGLGLLVSGGTDAHERRTPGRPSLGIEMPTALWKQFRDGLANGGPGVTGAAMPAVSAHPAPRLQRRHFILHIVCPTLLALALFTGAMFAVFLPAFQRSLMDRKRETIRELTTSAWSILAGYERDERSGSMSRAQAQRMARSRIELLRHGREGKDYFWLQDMRPRIIMHPYRRDLNGQDVSGFRDARGTRIFVEFADLVRRQGEGYIEYYWQWKDDPSRVVPKESYIKGFAPWGWIIGTGIYLEDVKQEIARVQRRLAHTLLGICALVAMLLAYVMQQSLRLERGRSQAEASLRETTERYRSLVEATTEGTLLVLDGRCRYANPTFRELVGYSEQEIGLLDLADLLPETGENEAAWEAVRALLRGEETTGGLEGVLRRRDGVLVECIFALSRMAFAQRNGFILLARDVRPPGARRDFDSADSPEQSRHFQEIADTAAIGLFRARATAPGALVDLNPVAERLVRAGQHAADSPLTLAALFVEPTGYEGFLRELQRGGAAERRLRLSTEALGPRTVALRGVLVRAERGAGHIDGVIVDVTNEERRAADRDALIERLQTPLLFLHEPVSAVSRDPLFVSPDMSIQSVAAMMSAQGATCALLRADAGRALGIVTDHDLRGRAVAAGASPQDPVHRIMSAPLVTIGAHAEIYEALLLMEEKGIQHLAVSDEDGRIVGVARSHDLLQFHSYGATVLTRAIAHAANADEVIASCHRVPGLAKALVDCGARPDRVTRMISAVCDAATQRFIALAEAELGPAPVPFAFLALGSQGRQEQTLASDQDNALVFTAGEGVDESAAAAYLVELGRRVCGWLDEAGYPYCRGGVMAQTPQWCQSLAVWKRYFSEWIQHAEPRELLEFSIFFDFRPVYGESELAHELRRHVNAEVGRTPAFLAHFAQNSLLFKPPLRLFGRIVGGGDHAGQLSLKDAAMPIVNFARLYALQEGLSHTPTLGRLEALAQQGALTEQSREQSAAAYNVLAGLRLQHHSAAVQAGQPLDNDISYRHLPQLEETLLRQSFAQIVALQKRISQDFLGGT